MDNRDFLVNIPSNWEIVRLKHVVATKITDGPHETPILLDSGIPFISAEAIKNETIDFSKKRGFISPKDHIKFSKKCSPKRNDIFIIKSGATTGNIAFVETDEIFDIWSPLALIRADKRIIRPKYLFYIIGSDLFKNQIKISWSFGTQQNIGMGVIENLFIPIPEYKIQKIINEYLEYKLLEVEPLISSKVKLVILLKEQRQAMITEAITKGLNPNAEMKDSGVKWIGEIPKHWEVTKIKHISNVKRGASPRPIDDPIYFDDNGKYSWVRISDVTNSKKYLLLTREKLSKLGASKSVKRHPNDIFVSIAGTVGKPCITKIECCIHDGFVYFENLKIEKEYLYYIFDAEQCYKGLGKMGTQLNLNTETIGGIVIPKPPKEEMDDIVNAMKAFEDNFSELYGLYQKQIAKLKEYRQSLIHEALTGKIPIEEMEIYLQEREKNGI